MWAIRPAVTCVTLAGFLVLPAPTPAWAEEFSTRVGRGADAHILRLRPTENVGADAVLRVKNAAASIAEDFDRKTYLRFDTLPLANRIVDSATLEMVIVTEPAEGAPVSGPWSFRVYGLNDGVAADAGPGDGGWIEGTGTEAAPTTSGISWDNAPANDGSPEGAGADATQLGGFTLDGTGVHGVVLSFSSPALMNFVSQDTNQLVTLIVTRETFDANFGGWIHRFASKESPLGQPPLLTVRTSCVLSGDLNCDCQVSLSDLATLLTHFGQIGGAAPTDGDIDRDGNINLTDLAILLSRFGTACP